MNRYYEKEGKRWHGECITVQGRTIINPSHEQLLAAGYEAREGQPYVATVAEVRAQKLSEIDAYDTSEAVNSFMLDGSQVWLDKATRVGLMNSLACESAAGRSETTLWLGTRPITLEIDMATELLRSVELYALACYNVTAQHKAAVEALDSVEAVEAYDYRTGYPERPVIETN